MTDKQVKKKNKDNKKKENEKTSKPKSSQFKFGKFILVSMIIAAAASYFVYKKFIEPPDIPEMDMNKYWGAYPMNPKPDVSIRPFRIEFSDVIVNDLRERILHHRPFSPPLEDTGSSYGFNTHFLPRVLDYWKNKYDFQAREQFFNKYPHFITNIQGLDMHYMHVKPKVSDKVQVVPILMLHGWPGSIRDFYEIIPKLTTPHSGYDFVFEIIAPSLPGFGYSQAAARPGLGIADTAVVMANLMQRIGHSRYYVQGGDFGHEIGSIMSTLFPDRVLGFHTNMPCILHPWGIFLSAMGSIWPRLVVEPELESRMYPWFTHVMRMLKETGYAHIQATKPDTIGVALTDSPAGLAAYILQMYSTWTHPNNTRAADGNLLARFSLTHLLDNIMMYWAPNCITTSMRLYAETWAKKELFMRFPEIPIDVPTWGIKFKYDAFYQPDWLLKFKFRNYLHSTNVEDGGHYAILEHPEIIANDIFEAVDSFKDFHNKDKIKPEDTTEVHYETAKTIHEFTVKDLKGRPVKLDKYKGYVVLIVNVASQCGLTDTNYQQLNDLHEKYSSIGLRILAFPCNQFGGQEPGSPRDIFEFAKDRAVKFDVFEKIEVNGDNAHPLWKFLKRTQSGTLGDFIKWNFSKFIINKDGVPVERLGPNVNPIDLEPYLAKYW